MSNTATLGTTGFMRNKDPLIIEQPDFQSMKQRYGQRTLAFLGWAGWLYLLLPLVNIIGWGFGAEMFYEKIIVHSDKVELTALVITYVILVTVVLNLIAGWALYHIWRFAGKERRKAQPEPTMDELSEYFRVKAYRIPQWQKTKRMTLHINDKGYLEDIDTIGKNLRKASSLL